MAIKRYFADADNTITNAFRPSLTSRGTDANMGASDVLEVFSVYGQASSGSTELERVLIKFPISEITGDRSTGDLPIAGGVSFYLKMSNARHSQTVPRQFTMNVSAVSRSWEEGFGLDMDEYSDIVYPNNEGSTWMSASQTEAWTRMGGDYHDSPVYTDYFDTGIEDLEIDVTPLVEEWIAGTKDNYGFGVHLTGTQEAYYSGVGGYSTSNDVAIWGFDLLDAQELIISIDGGTPQTIVLGGLSNPTTSIEVAASLNGPGQLVGAIADGTSTPGTVVITSDNKDDGPSSVSIDDASTAITIGLMSFTPTDVSSTSTRGQLNNLSGSQYSFYTKKFFGRNSEFYYKRPYIEARWDSALKDDRGNFYASSSLLSAEDNLHTIYLYNIFGGKLKNIPGVGTGEIYIKAFNSSSGGTDLTPTAVTGGFVSTGVYSASFALETSLTTVYDRWYNSGLTTCYHTGTIGVKSHAASAYNPNPKYVINITNLKPSYTKDEQVRFRLYSRQKDWSPTIYTVANSNIETLTIESASYQIHRIVDDLLIVPYGTSSDNYTQMSYDVSGNYFDFDMSVLQKGYSYGIKVAFYDENSYVEQPYLWKFRVESLNEY